MIRFNLSGEGGKQLQNSMANVTLFVKILVAMGTGKKSLEEYLLLKC